MLEKILVKNLKTCFTSGKNNNTIVLWLNSWENKLAKKKKSLKQLQKVSVDPDVNYVSCLNKYLKNGNNTQWINNIVKYIYYPIKNYSTYKESECDP